MSCCYLQLTFTSALAIQLIYFGFARNHQSLYIETKRELVEKTINTSLGEYPGVIMTIVLRRKINYHLLQVITMLLLAIFILLISIFRPLSLFTSRFEFSSVNCISFQVFPQKSGIFNRCLSNSCQNHDASPSLRIQLGKTNNPWNSQNWTQQNIFLFFFT